INLLQSLEPRRAVHIVRSRRIGIVGIARIPSTIGTRVHPAPGWHVGAGGTSHRAAGWSAAIDILPIAQFVVVTERVIALARIKALQTILAARVHRQKLLAIFLAVVIKQLLVGGESRPPGRNVVEAGRGT